MIDISNIFNHYGYILLAIADCAYITLVIAAYMLFPEFNRVINANRNKIANFRLRLLFLISDRLEPDTIADFRRSIAKTFDELSDFLEKAEMELLRSRMNSIFLKDKVAELERSREALLQELGGSSDFLSIEFAIWQQIIQTIDLLINERATLLQKIALIDAYDGNFEALSQDLAALQVKYQAAEQKVSALTNDQITLKAKNEQLSQQGERLHAIINLLQGAGNKAQMLEQKVSALKQTESTLKQQLDQSKHQINQSKHQINQSKQQNTRLEQQNSQLQRKNAQLERVIRESNSTITALKNSIQDYVKANESLKKELKRVRTDLIQKKAQIRQKEHQELAQQKDTILEESQTTLNLQDSSIDNCDCERIAELEAEILYLYYLTGRAIERVSVWDESNPLSCRDRLDYIEYWRDHPDGY